jgi:hypothetical protein
MDSSGTLASIQDSIAIQTDVAAKMLMGIIDGSKRETHGGEFINIDGEKISW